jgi:hypothetical protein
MGKLLQTAKPRLRKRKLSSIVGKHFAMLAVLHERRIKNGLGKSRFDVLVECKCGAQKWVEERSVRRGLVKSCGRCANKTHGLSKTPEYAVWRSMLDRCRLPAHQAYKNYGGRGITVCKRWATFENFFMDMGKQPFKGASIDRIDNNKGYSPANCRWANATQQHNNRRSNKFLVIDGVRQTIAQWSNKSGVCHNTISYRLANGWPPKKAVFTEPNFTNRLG